MYLRLQHAQGFYNVKTKQDYLNPHTPFEEADVLNKTCSLEDPDGYEHIKEGPEERQYKADY